MEGTSSVVRREVEVERGRRIKTRDVPVRRYGGRDDRLQCDGVHKVGDRILRVHLSGGLLVSCLLKSVAVPLCATHSAPLAGDVVTLVLVAFLLLVPAGGGADDGPPAAASNRAGGGRATADLVHLVRDGVGGAANHLGLDGRGDPPLGLAALHLALPVILALLVRVERLHGIHDVGLVEAKVLGAGDGRLGRRRQVLAGLAACLDLSVDPLQDGRPAACAALRDERLVRAVQSYDAKGREWPVHAALPNDVALVDAQRVEGDRGAEQRARFESLGENVAGVEPALLDAKRAGLDHLCRLVRLLLDPSPVRVTPGRNDSSLLCGRFWLL